VKLTDEERIDLTQSIESDLVDFDPVDFVLHPENRVTGQKIFRDREESGA